jgi:hypothetical protein
MELSRYTQDCGCSLSVYSGTHEWYICSLHYAAPKLLAALEGLVGAFRDNPNKPRNSKDWEYTIETDVFAEAIPQARAAIEAAKGER